MEIQKSALIIHPLKELHEGKMYSHSNCRTRNKKQNSNTQDKSEFMFKSDIIYKPFICKLYRVVSVH